MSQNSTSAVSVATIEFGFLVAAAATAENSLVYNTALRAMKASPAVLDPSFDSAELRFIGEIETQSAFAVKLFVDARLNGDTARAHVWEKFVPVIK